MDDDFPVLSKFYEIHVSLTPSPVSPDETVVLIDALRFTTTAAIALDAGVSKIIPSRSLEECLMQKQPGELLAGEKQGRTIDGFDLGNSPSTFRQKTYAGSTVRFLTSNGSPACFLAKEAKNVFLASYVNCTAVARRLLDFPGKIHILCSGARGEPCVEDSACAGVLAMKFLDLAKSIPGVRIELAHQVSLAAKLWSGHDGDLRKLIFESAWGQRLAELGLHADLEIAAQMDLVQAVPRLQSDPLQIVLDQG